MAPFMKQKQMRWQQKETMTNRRFGENITTVIHPLVIDLLQTGIQALLGLPVH
jgi:hypothetical protein